MGPAMTFVTNITLRSGDRVVLDATADEIKSIVSRKGAELKGPHPRPPTTLRVPQSKRLSSDGGTFDPWEYRVYTRDMRIVGYDAVTETVVRREFPASVHVALEVERLGAPGS